jgi:type III restriction enzyme
VDSGSVNQYERAIALCLDKDENVLWWYRNLVGQDNFAIQGPRRHKIYPDFVVQRGVQRPTHCVLVLEGKGPHLEGNPDTTYKRSVADYFERVGKKVTWQQLGEDFKDHVFRFQVLSPTSEAGRDWRDELSTLLAAG